MRILFRCLAESAAEIGIRDVLHEVRGGKLLCDFVEKARDKYRKRVKELEQREQIEELAQASFEQARAAAVEAVRESLAVAAVPPDESDVVLLELYLAATAEATRQSLKSSADPTGRTAPAGFALASDDDLAQLLPVRAPRFAPGDALPGKAGWLLERPLGLGGFGEVWLARHAVKRAQHGAVKFYFDQQGRDLIRERELVNRVMRAGGHPNVVPLKGVNPDGATPWLMFEYVGGGNLVDRLHRFAARPAEERLAFAFDALKQTATAAAHLHTLTPPLIHRDLKPANVLYDQATKRYRVTDFGIGAITAEITLKAERQGTATQASQRQLSVLGAHTPVYASLQQRNGAKPSPQDDVHALGVIAYQLFVGRPDAEVRGNWMRELSKRGVPAEMIELVSDCCAEEPGDRPKDAREVLQRLGVKIARPQPKVVAKPIARTKPVSVPPVVLLGPERVRKVTPTQMVPGAAGRSRLRHGWLVASVVAVTVVAVVAVALGGLGLLMYHSSQTGNTRATVSGGDTASRSGDAGAKWADATSPTLTSNTGKRHVSIAGWWYSRPANQPSAYWAYVCETPASVETSATEVYSLQVDCNADLSKLDQLAELPSLTSLAFSDCKELTDAGVGQVAVKFTGLTYLGLRGCDKVTDAAVERLKRALPNCKVRR